MSLGQRVLHALSWTAGAKLAGQVFTWTVTIIVMRLLSPQDYGLLAMAMVLIAFFQLFDELGMLPAVVQSQELTELNLQQVLGSVIVINAGFLLLLAGTAPLVAWFFGEPRVTALIWVLSSHFLFKTALVIPDALMQRQYRLKEKALMDLGASMASSLATLAAAWWGLGVWSLVAGTLVNGVVRTVSYNLACPFLRRPRFELPASRGLVRFGVHTLLSRFAWFLYSQADVLIAGKLLGKVALGYYTVGMHWASLPLQKTMEIMYAVAFPSIARIQSDRALVAASVLKASRLLSLVVFPVLFGMSAVAAELVAVLLGPKWENSAIVLQLLTLVMPLRALNSFLFAAADGVGRADLTLRGNLLALLVMPVAMLVAAQWGLVGFCAAWLAAYPVVFALNGARILPVLGIRFGAFLAAMVGPLVAASGMYLAVAAVRAGWTWPSGELILLVVLVLSGVAAYVGLSYAVNRRGCLEVVDLMKNRA